MTTPKNSSSFINTIITVGATSLLLGAASVHAASNTQQQTQNTQQTPAQSQQNVQSTEQLNTTRSASDIDPEFSAADQNQDGVLVWTEIWDAHEDDLANAGMDEESTLSAYDINNDQALDSEEYAVFITDMSEYAAASDETNQTTTAESDHYRIEQERDDRTVTSTEVQEPQVRGTDLTGTPAQPLEGSERPVQFHQAFTAIIDSGTSPEELQDLPVINSLGEEIGEVQDVVMSNDGREAGVVIEVGGILGIGAKEIFLNAEELGAGPDGQEIVWESSLDEDAAKDLPEYDEERFTSLTEEA